MRDKECPLMKTLMSEGYYKKSFAWLESCGISMGDADDLWQNFSIRVMSGCKNYDSSRPSVSYLNQVLYNMMIDKHRVDGRKKHVNVSDISGGFSLFDSIEGNRDSPLEAMEGVERAGVIENVFDSIPKSHRTVLKHRYLEGRPYAEIAEMYEMSGSAIKSLLSRARGSFRRMVENKGLSLQLNR